MKTMPRTHSFRKRIDRRRFELPDADDNTIFLYERDDGTTVKCTRPGGVRNQSTPEPIEGLDANGSYTDYQRFGRLEATNRFQLWGRWNKPWCPENGL